MPDSTQPGGASTNYGVLYQTLWCLMKAARIRVGKDGFPGTDTDALMILEPRGGGGDVTLQSTITEVDQVKAKADQGAWSLQTVICDVLPDLFLAIKDDSTTYRMRFVTEGNRGRWDDVYNFFRRLGRTPEPDSVWDALDDKVALKFQTRRTANSGESSSIFLNESYTERTLFELIVAQIRSRPLIAKQNLSDTIFLKRVWKLLGAFEFEENQQLIQVQREIDHLLLAVVDHRDDIPNLRQALAFSLMDKASSGNAEITAESLFAEHNLNALSLRDWTSIRSRASQDLSEQLQRTGYNSNLDVRKSDSLAIASKWHSEKRVLIVAGESGQGKTWTLAAIAEEKAKFENIVIWLEATGSATNDLQRAADRIWLDIRGGDRQVPLAQVGRRLGEFLPKLSERRSYVFIDNITDYDEAVFIINDALPGKGISIAISCSDAIAKELESKFQREVAVSFCSDFSWEQLHELLHRRLGPEWTLIDDAVRETLRRPLLAAIYCDEVFASNWHPTNEYELYDAYWNRLSTRQQTVTPMDEVAIEALAERVLNDEPYGRSTKAVSRFLRVSLKTETKSGCFIINLGPHPNPSDIEVPPGGTGFELTCSPTLSSGSLGVGVGNSTA